MPQRHIVLHTSRPIAGSPRLVAGGRGAATIHATLSTAGARASGARSLATDWGGRLLVGLGMQGRARRARAGTDAGAAQEAAALARRVFAGAGTNSVGYFALLGDKELWSDSQGRGVVAFQRRGGTALVAGDPLATPADLPAVLDGFLAHCRAQGWTPAFYQTLDATLRQYRARGFHALAIGREALIDLPTFTLRGKPMANVRHSVTHAERAGLRVRLQSAAGLDAATRAELAALSTAWLAAKGGRAMHFTMGSLLPDGQPLPGSRVALARDEAGRVQAFLTVVPAGGGRGWMLDLMRRHHTAVSGSMDLLIARTAEALRAEGCALFSLSLAPLASSAGDDEDAPVLVRWARGQLYEKMQGAYNYQSLFNYKRKFNVRWETRYLVYAGTASLPAALYATARAHLPEGLIAVPSLRPALVLPWVGARPAQGDKKAA